MYFIQFSLINRYLPDITGKEPVVKDAEVLDPDDNDLKKMCSIM